MSNLTKALLWCAAGCYFLFKSYRGFHDASPYASRFDLYFLLLIGGICIWSAFGTLTGRINSKARRDALTDSEPLTRGERIVFKALGVSVVFVGLVFLGFAVWLGWEEWNSVVHWPRTDAVLMSKDISRVGARMVFQYQAEGKQVSGLGSAGVRSETCETH